MKTDRVKVILHETYYPRDVTDLIARETGAQVLVVSRDPGAIKGTETYISHLDFLVNALAKALA
jgi:ABC-type Zn uptake system ZnuABC Zn-binding protein ZnuA